MTGGLTVEAAPRHPCVMLLATVALAFGAQASAQDYARDAAPDFSEVRAEIRRALAEWDAPSLAVAVAVDGEVAWEEGFGWADRERRIPATEHTMYSLASISKPITATGLMVLVERGLVDLDAPANDYLGPATINGRAFDAREATLRRVASHTAGLPLHYQFFYEDEPYRRPPMDETIRRYANLVTAPGECWNYSNLGYGILDYIIERVSGLSYPGFMRAEVFAPLGLTRTSVGIGPGLEEYAARRYAADQSPIPFYDFDHPGGSAVFSSAHDLARFGLFHLGQGSGDGETGGNDDVASGPDGAASGPDGAARRIISDASIEEMRRLVRDGYGLGWSLRELPGGLRLQRHGGGMGGVRTELAIAHEEDAVVVVLMNAASPLTGYVAALIWHALFPDQAPRPDPPEAPSAPPPPSVGAVPDMPPGRWTGAVHTHLGERALELSVDEDGLVLARLAEDLWTALNNATFDGEFLRGVFRGDIGTPDANRTDYALRLELKLRGDVLNGSVTALTLPNARLGNALSHWAELRRQR